jgi:hypothetical protein
LDFGDIIGNAFQYTYNGLTGKPVTWLLLVIMSQLYYIPLIGAVIFMIAAGIRPETMMSQLPLIAAGLAVTFLLILLISSFYQGFMIPVMNKEAEIPAFPDPWILFGNGIRYTIVYLVYFIIPILLVLGTIVLALLPVINSPATHTAAPQLELVLTMLAGFTLAFLSAVVLYLFWVTGIVRFARTGSLPEAFSFTGILGTIRRIGWGFYCLALVILAILLFIFGIAMFVIQTILGIIPVIGFVFVLVMLLVQIVLGPFITIFMHRYFSLLYDCAEPA